MPWMMAAAAIGGSLISSNAAGDAADTQAAAANRASDISNQQYQQTRTDNLPALDARNASLAKMRDLLGIGAAGGGGMASAPSAADVMNQPGYQFGRDQGQQAIQRQASARGMLNSGQALTAAARYGNDYATTKYDNAFNQLQSSQTNTFNRLASVAGYGQTGANQIGQAGIYNANQMGSAAIGAGNAAAAAGMGQANTWASAGNQLAGWYANKNQGGGGASGPSNADLWSQINGG